MATYQSSFFLHLRSRFPWRGNRHSSQPVGFSPLVSQGRTPLDCLEVLCPVTSSGVTGRQVPTSSLSLTLTTSGAQRTGPGFLPLHSTWGWAREVRSCRPLLFGTPLFPVKDVFQIVSNNNYRNSGERLTSLLTLLLVRLPLRTRDTSGFLRLFGTTLWWISQDFATFLLPVQVDEPGHPLLLLSWISSRRYPFLSPSRIGQSPGLVILATMSLTFSPSPNWGGLCEFETLPEDPPLLIYLVNGTGPAGSSNSRPIG